MNMQAAAPERPCAIATQATLIIEIAMPPVQLVLFQAILQGEDGLCVMRCFDPEKKKQQLWTTPAQKDEVYAFLNSLPEYLDIELTGEWIRKDIYSA